MIHNARLGDVFGLLTCLLPFLLACLLTCLFTYLHIYIYLDAPEMCLGILLQLYQTNQVLQQVPTTPVQQLRSMYGRVNTTSELDRTRAQKKTNTVCGDRGDIGILGSVGMQNVLSFSKWQWHIYMANVIVSTLKAIWGIVWLHRYIYIDHARSKGCIWIMSRTFTGYMARWPWTLPRHHSGHTHRGEELLTAVEVTVLCWFSPREDSLTFCNVGYHSQIKQHCKLWITIIRQLHATLCNSCWYLFTET